MSVECINWAAGLSIDSTEKFVLMALSNSANCHDGRTWTAWPSIAYMARWTSLHETTVKTAIRHLVGWGLISKQKRKLEYKTARGNHYTLHLERSAPQDVGEVGSAARPIPDVDQETCDKTVGCDDSENERSPTATYDRDSWATDAEVQQDSTATCVGTPGLPVYKNRKLEPENIPPPSPPTGVAAPDAASLWSTIIATYQQRGYLKFLGEEDPAWRVFKNLAFETQKKISVVLPNYLSGKRAQYAKWNAEPADRRGQKPKGPVGIEEFIKTRLFDSVGLPREIAPEQGDLGKALCERILARNAPATERDFRWPFWHVVGSAEFQEWELFFRAHGFAESPRRAAGFPEFEIMPRQFPPGAKKGDIGWRLPTQWPPAFDKHQEENAA